MSKKPETTFKDRILPKIKGLPNSWFEKISQRATRGTPDILGCIKGTMIAIELKRSAKAKPDELQKYKLAAIKKAGGMTFVAYPGNWDQVYEKLLTLAIGVEYEF